MGKAFSRPLVLLPLGVVVLLVGLLTALNGVASARWGSALEDGILGMSLGVGMLIAGTRMRRATGSWVEHEPLQKHGTAALALPVVVGFVVWMAPRFVW